MRNTMIKRELGISVLAFLMVLLSAEVSPASDIGTPPWHLVDIWHKFDGKSEFRSLSIDVEIVGDVEREVGLYIAPFYSRFGDVRFYGGIQNHDNIVIPKDNKKVDFNRNGIFSRWDERDLAYTQTERDGWNETGGYEGNFVSVRAPFPWKSGIYTFTISVIDQPGQQDSKDTWVQMYIQTHEDNTIRSMGALKFPGRPLVLSDSFASFVEIFSLQGSSAKLPKLTISFFNLLINGKAPKTDQTAAVFPEKIPDIAQVTSKDGKISVILDDAIVRSTRTVELK